MQAAEPIASQQITPCCAERICRLVQWAPFKNNPSLIGRATIAFAGGWIVVGIPIFRSKDGLSVGVPNAAQLDAEGRIKIRDGKKQYTSVVTFETAEARERSRRLVLAALAQAGVGA
jgi:hypothetical protein